MSDIALTWDELDGDLMVGADGLLVDDSLQSAVIVSLFTDRRAESDDVPPGDPQDPRGWWGDTFTEVAGDRIGSRLWLLSREKETAAVLSLAKEYAEEALAWMVEDRIADRVEVVTAFVRRGVLGIGVMIYRPDQEPAEYRFNVEWAAQSAKVA